MRVYLAGSIFYAGDVYRNTDWAARIRAAIQEGEQITVFGDYDADGITSSAILVHCLKSLGAKVTFYIPEREKQ